MILFTDELLSKAAYEVDMAILDMLPDPRECVHAFSSSFETKIKKIIRKAKYFVVYKMLRRVACVFISIILTTSLFIAFNPHARAVVVDWLREKVDDFYHYFFVGEYVPEETIVLSPSEEAGGTIGADMTDAMDTTSTPITAGNMKDYSLAWVPDGYVLLDSIKDANGATFFYADSAGQMMQFIYMYGIVDQPLLVGGGDYSEKHVTVGDLSCELLLSNVSTNSNAIVWKSNDGNTMFTISAFLGEADLIKMAENMVVDEKT